MWKLILLVLIPTYYILHTIYLHPVGAQSLQDQLDQKQEEIEEAEEKLTESVEQQKSLKLQLAALDGQARLTQLKIEATTLRKQQLQQEIEDSAEQNARVKKNLDLLEAELAKKLQDTDGVPVWDLLFPWEGFGKVRERYAQLKRSREDAKKLLVQVQQAKQYYEKQEEARVERAGQSEALEAELKKHQVELAESKEIKSNLLEVTKNDEATFQRLIAQLQEEAEAIDKAISNLGRVVGVVSRGQQIGAVGLTGCTSGAHLHFETYENARVENNRVVGSRVNPRKLLNAGSVGSPLVQFPGAVVSAEYGIRYALGFHTGIDIVVPVGTAVLASENGTAYAISGTGCRIKGFDHGESRGMVIDHHNGFVSLYWHMQ